MSFVSSVKSNFKKEYREIYLNPSRKELKIIKDLNGDVELVGRYSNFRFLALGDKEEVYVTSVDVFHANFIRYIDDVEHFLDKYVIMNGFSGIGKYRQGKVEARRFSDAYEMSEYNGLDKVKRDISNGRYDWMERYNFKLNYIKKNIESEELDMRGFM